MKQFIVNTETLAQQLVDYLNATNTVSCCALQVTNTTLPTLVTPPDNYGDFANTLGVVKVKALAWNNDVLTSFNTLPDAYINFNAQIQQQLGVVALNLTTLATHPGDASAISTIKSAIGSLVDETNPGITYFTNLGTWITNYGNSLQPSAVLLKAVCLQIAQSEKLDQAAVAKLNAVYDNLDDLVKQEQELITLATVGNVVFGIFLAVVGVAVGIPFSGAAAIIVGLLVGVGSAVYTTLDPLMNPPPFAQTQEQLQDLMNRVNTEIGAMNTIVGQLQITANQLQKLIDQSVSASKCIQTVVDFWQALQNDLNGLVGDLDAILNDLSDPSAIAAAQADIQQAINSWNDLQQYMNSIKGIQYILPTGVIMPGNTQLPLF